MDSIAVTKPNMAITGREALSPFGLLSELFTEELAGRRSLSTGFYRPMTLAYLEESEGEASSNPPEIHFDLNVDLLLGRLLKDARDKEKNEEKPKTPAERILERVVVRERELRTFYRDTRRMVIETGGRRFTANAPERTQALPPGSSDHSMIETAFLPSRQEIIREGETVKLRAAKETTHLHVSHPFSTVVSARPISFVFTEERRIGEKTLPLASQMLSVPAKGGWTPRERELHPGYPVRTETIKNGGPETGSILLPDVLRRRREDAIARSETQMSAVGPQADLDAFGEALEWITEGTERTAESERVFLEVRRAVDETLRRNAARDAALGKQPFKLSESDELNAQNYQSEQQSSNNESSLFARAHAYEQQAEVPKTAQKTERSEAASRSEGRETALKERRKIEASDHSSIEAEGTARRSYSEQSAEKMRSAEAEAHTHEAADKYLEQASVVPDRQEAEVSAPAELAFREGTDGTDPIKASAKVLKTVERLSEETAEPYTPQGTAHTVPSKHPDTEVDQGSGIISDIRTAKEAQPETFIPAGIPAGSEAQLPEAEMKLRETPEENGEQKTIRSAISDQTRSVQPSAETVVRTDFTDRPAAIKEHEKQRELRGIAPQTAKAALGSDVSADSANEASAPEMKRGYSLQTEARYEASSKTENAIHSSVFSGAADQQPAQGKTSFPENIAEIKPQSAAQTEKSEQLNETARAAVPAETEVEQPEAAELTYREETEATVPQSAEHAGNRMKPQGSASFENREFSGDSATQGSMHSEFSAQPKQAVITAIPTGGVSQQPFRAETVYRESPEGDSKQSNPYAKTQPVFTEQPKRPVLHTMARTNTLTETPAQQEEAVPNSIPAVEAAKSLPSETFYLEGAEKPASLSVEHAEITKPAQGPVQVSAEILQTKAAPKVETEREPVKEAEQMDLKPGLTYAQPEPSIPSRIPSAEASAPIEPAELTYRDTEETIVPPGLAEAVKTTYWEKVKQADFPTQKTARKPLQTEITYPGKTEATAPQSAIETEKTEGSIRPETPEATFPQILAESKKTARPDAVVQTAAPAEESPQRTEPAELIYREIPSEAVRQGMSESDKTAKPDSAVHTAIPAEVSAQLPVATELKYRETAEAADHSKTPLPQTAMRTNAPTETPTLPKTAIPSDLFAEKAQEEGKAELTYRESAQTSVPHNSEHAKIPDHTLENVRIPSEKPSMIGSQAQVFSQFSREIEANAAAVNAVSYPEPEKNAVQQSSTLVDLTEQPETAVPVEAHSEEYAFNPSPTELNFREGRERFASQNDAHEVNHAHPEASVQTSLPTGKYAQQPSAETVYREVTERSAPHTSSQAKAQVFATDQTKASVPQYLAHTDTRKEKRDKLEEAIPYAVPAETGTQQPSPAETVYLEKAESTAPQSAGRPEHTEHARGSASLPNAITAKTVGSVHEQARSSTDISPKASASTAVPDREKFNEAEEQERIIGEAPAQPETPTLADLTSEEAAVSTAVPAEEFAQRTAQAEIAYLENMDNAAPESTFHTKRPIRQQRSAHTSKEISKNADGSVQGKAFTQTEASKNTTFPTVDEHREQTAENVQQSDVNAESPSQAETAIPSSIPAEEAIYSAASEELVFRKNTEENGQQSVNGAGYPAQPETEAQAAYPTEENTQESLPSELTYRRDVTEAVPQTYRDRTNAAAQGRTAVHRNSTAIEMQNRAHHAGQPQIVHPLPMTAGKTARDIRVSADHGIKPIGLAHSGTTSSANTPQGASPEQETAGSAFPVMEETDAVMPQELVFAAPAQGVQPPADPTEARPPQPQKVDRTEELPKWAKELLEKSGVTDTAVHSGVFGGKNTSQNANQVKWNSPIKPAAQNYAQNGPVDLSFKERAEEENRSSSQFRITDAELQRTADRVYKIIEERLRRELRRSGR